MDAKFCLFFHARARMVQQKMSAFSPQLYVSKKLEEAKLQWKKEKLNNIGVLQKKVLVSEIKIKFLIDWHQSTTFCPVFIQKTKIQVCFAFEFRLWDKKLTKKRSGLYFCKIIECLVLKLLSDTNNRIIVTN